MGRLGTQTVTALGFKRPVLAENLITVFIATNNARIGGMVLHLFQTAPKASPQRPIIDLVLCLGQTKHLLLLLFCRTSNTVV